MILLFETANARVEHSGKKTYLEGIYMVGGRVNNNNRFYKTEMLSDLVSDLQPTIKEGGLLGELGHNNEATTPDYNRVSHVVKSLRHTGKGEFFGRAEVLKEGAGKVLQSCIDAGARIGISTKGQGQTQKMKDVNGNIYELVLPDYKLISCDAVHSPSAPGSIRQSNTGRHNVEQIYNNGIRLGNSGIAIIGSRIGSAARTNGIFASR